ncbi:MAG: hypothetical protein Q9221_000848 [Calogaya cf. arnoldii]
MSSNFESETFAAAIGLPGSELTPEYRFHDHFFQDLHRLSDAGIDNKLDFFLYNNLLEHQIDPLEQELYPGCSTIGSGARPAIMAEGNDSTSTATAAVGLREGDEEILKLSRLEPTDSPLAWQSNEFDNPDFHKSEGDEGHDRVDEDTNPEPSIETKQEAAPTAVMIPSAPADLLTGQHGIDASFPLQRVYSEPINRSINNWQSDDSEGSPISYPTHTTNGTHYADFQPVWPPRVQVLKAPLEARGRTPPGPTSHPRQNGASSTPSILSNAAFQHLQPGSFRFPPDAISYGRLNNSLAHNLGGQYYNYEAVSGVGMHHHMLGFDQSGGLINNPHVNRNSIQHNNNDGPLSANSHLDLTKMPQENVLKSQSPLTSSNVRNKANTSRSQPRGSMKAQSRLDHMEERKKRPTSPPPEIQLHYNDIESARQAERPKFKTNPDKDPSIPMTDAYKRWYVGRMIRCMKRTEGAQDNAGMINQWHKLSQDGPRMEQAAWRLLDMALQTQKTMCKHLLGSEFAAQLVNDPTTATQRVQNNRKVNAGKKSYLDTGRLAVHGGVARSVPRGSSSSTRPRAEDSDDDGCPYGENHPGSGNASLFGEMGDEDAEGDTDEEYLNPTRNASVDQIHAAVSEPAPTHRPKREHDNDDSDEYGRRAKKSRRTSTKTHPTAAKRHLKTPRKAGDKSKFQTIGNIMLNVHDKTNENAVYERGSAHARELFDKFHYPNGRPSSLNGHYIDNPSSFASEFYASAQTSPASSSRRLPREAAPTSFRGLDDTSTEGDDLFSGSRNGEADGSHQGQGPQQT